MKRKRVDVNLKELDQIIDHAREVPLSESESGKLKEALHAGGHAAAAALYGENQRGASARRSAAA